jgi:hypothetical protein
MAVAVAACGADTVAPQDPALTTADIAGTYTATGARWTATADAGTHFDLVGTGGTYEMAVLEDGTFTTRIGREGHEDMVATGRFGLDAAGAMTLTENGISRAVEYQWDNGTFTWRDAGARWDFGAGGGMEGATFDGTFVRQ